MPLEVVEKLERLRRESFEFPLSHILTVLCFLRSDPYSCSAVGLSVKLQEQATSYSQKNRLLALFIIYLFVSSMEGDYSRL